MDIEEMIDHINKWIHLTPLDERVCLLSMCKNWMKHQQSQITKLKADLLEMAEALTLQAGQQDSCPECGEWADFNLPIVHKNCTVLKAQRIIKEGLNEKCR